MKFVDETIDEGIEYIYTILSAAENRGEAINEIGAYFCWGTPVIPEEPETTSVSSSLSDTHCFATAEKVCAVPTNGQMSFNCNADDALNALRLLLGNKNVNLVVSWTVTEE